MLFDKLKTDTDGYRPLEKYLECLAEEILGLTPGNQNQKEQVTFTITRYLHLLIY